MATARRVPIGAMTIEELGACAGITTRTIRSYQTIGMLRGPRKVGRIGYYSEDHIERLTAIGRLMHRGFSLASIAALFHAYEQGHSLGHVLGVDESVASRPAMFGEAGAPGPTGEPGATRAAATNVAGPAGVIDLR